MRDSPFLPLIARLLFNKSPMKTILLLLLTCLPLCAATTYPMLSTTTNRTVTGGVTNMSLLNANQTFSGTNTITTLYVTNLYTVGTIIVPSASSRAGNATLVGGTIAVAVNTVTADSIVMITRKTSGGTIGTAITYTLNAGTGFTINSDNILDTSVFSYFVIENP